VVGDKLRPAMICQSRAGVNQEVRIQKQWLIYFRVGASSAALGRLGPGQDVLR
jgi:hypothetical protein